MQNLNKISLLLLIPYLLIGCASDGIENLTPDRYQATDALYDQVKANVELNSNAEFVLEVDHSRFAKEAGGFLPPSRVLLFSNPRLEAELLITNPLTAMELPLRVLAYEDTDGSSKIIFNSGEYLANRHGLDNPQLITRYDQALTEVTQGIDEGQIAHFEHNALTENGLITWKSAYDFETTVERVYEAIHSQDDTVVFGEVDYQAQLAKNKQTINPTTLILFGGPIPGAKAMNGAPTLGVDAFCQKFLVWEDNLGNTYLTVNDLLALSERQGYGWSLPLQVIMYRLTNLFEEAVVE